MTPPLPFDPQEAIDRLKAIQIAMRSALVHDLQRHSASDRSAVASDHGGGDTIYAIDQNIEHTLVSACRDWARQYPFVLVAEGLGESGQLLLPEGTSAEPLFRVIVDPIDGTRGLMYDKRSAWILAGHRPRPRPQTPTSPTSSPLCRPRRRPPSSTSPTCLGRGGAGAHAERHNLLTGEVLAPGAGAQPGAGPGPRLRQPVQVLPRPQADRRRDRGSG